MKLTSKSALLTLTLLLGACSHYSNDLSSLDGQMAPSTAVAYTTTVSPDQIAPAAGGTQANKEELSKILAREYYDLARYENDKAYDYKSAKNFTSKAMVCAKGEVPAPSRISSYDIPKERIPELAEARKALVAALKDPSAPMNSQALAKAQIGFDCWVERAEEADKDDHFAQCKSDYEQAMASLVTPAAGGFTTPNVFDIPFAQNSNRYDNAVADPVIVQVANFLKSPQASQYTAVLTGFTEPNPQSEYSSNLATQRVWAVRDALIAQGVDPTRIKPQLAHTPNVTEVNAVALPDTSLARKVQIFLNAPIIQPEPVLSH